MKKQNLVAKKHRFQLSDFEVKPDSHVKLDKWSTKAGKQSLAKDLADEALAADVLALHEAQERLYASNRYALLVILQGMDASGKDGAIGHVMSGVNRWAAGLIPLRHPTRKNSSITFCGGRCLACLRAA